MSFDNFSLAPEDFQRIVGHVQKLNYLSESMLTFTAEFSTVFILRVETQN